MDATKRRSMRSTVPSLGVAGHAESNGASFVPLGVEEASMDTVGGAPSDCSRCDSVSPTPTVGTATGAGPSPIADYAAPQPRLRRPMNSFLLFSNEHRETA